jgi:hypothetical protein
MKGQPMKLSYRKCLLIATAIGGAVVAFAGNAGAAFITSGTYDENTNQGNAVDTTAASSNVTLGHFKTLISNAFNADTGGVIAFDSTQAGTTGLGAGDTSSGSTIINAVYGTSVSNTLTITRELYAGGTGAPNFSISTSGGSSVTESISGSGTADADQKWLGSSSGNGNDWRMTFSTPLVAFGITALYRPSATYTIDLEIGLSDSSTATFTQESIVGVTSGDGSDDTFFGYVAPTGVTISYVRANNSALGRWDDVAFIIPEPISVVSAIVGLIGLGVGVFWKRKGA